MRLRWPWQQPDRSDSPAPASASDRPAPAKPPVQRAPLDEWRDLAPPRGLSGPPDLTADRRFGRTTSGGRGLPPVIEPVARGGELAPLMRSATSRPTASSDGPAPGYGRSAEMSFRPRRRAEADALEPAPSAETEEPQAPAGSPLPAPSVPNRAVARTAVAGSETARPAPRQRSAMAVVPAAQRSAIEGSKATGRIDLDRSTAPSVHTAEPAQESELPEKPAVAEVSTSADAPAAATKPASPQRSPLAGPGRTVRSRTGSTRKLGLGAPLTSEATPTTTPSEAPTAPAPSSPAEAPLPAAAAPTTDRSPQRSSLTTSTSSVASSAQPAIAPLPPAKPFTTTASASDAAAVPSAAVPQATMPAQAPIAGARAQRSPAVTAAPIHQRASRPGASSTSAAPPAARPASTGSSGKVRIDRSSAASGAAADLEANAYTSGDTIVMPQHHGPLDRGRGQALLAHELVHVGQQRRMGSSLPAEHTSAGQQLEREAQSAEKLVERQRSTAPALDMPVARPQRAAAETSSDHSSEVRQATELALSAGASGSSDGSIELPAAGATAHGSSGPGPQRAARSSSSASMSGGGSGSSSGTDAKKSVDEQELEELARKLYDRLRLRFKRELLHDRERGGYLADPR